MSIIRSTLLAAAETAAYTISRSVRLRSSASAYFNRTPASATNRKTWTYSGWVKRGALGSAQALLEAGNGTGTYTMIWFTSSDQLQILQDNGAGGVLTVTTNAVFRDPSSWYHVVVAVDTTQATSNNRTIFYVNGVNQSLTYTTQLAQNADTWVDYTYQHRVGGRTGGTSYFDGYLTEINFIDGQALTPSSFGEYDAVRNTQWKPKRYAGTYGTNGFYLPFTDNTLNTLLSNSSNISAPYGGTATNALAADGVYCTSNVSAGSNFTFLLNTFATATQVTRYSITNLSFTGGVSTFSIQSSPNNSIWTTLATLSVTASNQNFSGSLNGYAKYFRIAPTAFGTNGSASVDAFLLYADGLGLDSSGNGNNWTPNGILLSPTTSASYDSMLDVPTLTSESASNYAVLNPLLKTTLASPTYSQGNLVATAQSNVTANTIGTIGVSSGKWYWEILISNIVSSTSSFIGIMSESSGDDRYYASNGQFWNGSAWIAYGTSYTGSNYIGVALDKDAGTIEFFRDGVSQGIKTGVPAGISFPWNNAFITGGSAIVYANFGQRPFSSTPPTGFKRLNTYNLPEPSVASSDDYHKVYTYTGNGGGLQVGEIQKPLSLYNLDRSLRFKGTNSYFDKVFASGGANTKGTFSFWVKRGKLAVQQELVRFGTTGTLFSGLYFSATDTLNFVRLNSTYQTALYTTRVFRDPNAWYHIVVAWDSTLGPSSNSVKIYINGIQETVFTSSTYPSASLDMYFFTAGTHNIGRYPVGGNYFGGYMAEFHAVDGTQLTANDFGQFDGNYYWTPKDYTGGYGTNGWHLDFEDFSSMSATGIGKDVSGNGHNFTPYNFDVTTPANTNASWDSMVDVPTLTSADVANFATWSPFNTGQSSTTTSTLSNGNLLATGGAINTTWSAVSTIVLPTTGKWYFEAEMSATSYGNGTFGIFALGSSTINAYAQLGVGTRVNDNVLYTYTGYNTVFPNRIGIAYDADNGLLWQTDINGNWLNSKVPAVDTTGLVSGITKRDDYVIGWKYNSGAETNRTCSLNCGQKPFFYTPPTGFKSLNSFNIAEVTGDIESPDFVWIKSRSAATGHALFNSVTGVGKYLSSNATTAETTDVNSLIQFNKNGFLLGNAAIVNTSAATYVASAWKSGSTTVTNTDGSISSQVRANPTAGISIVTYTGTGANATVGHGLGVAPKMVIVKGRNNTTPDNWWTWHTGLTSGSYALLLNLTNAQTSYANIFNTAPTSTTFAVQTGAGVNESGKNFVAYCWSEIAGYSKFGSYTGNGSADGPFVFTNFRPRWLIIKRTDTTGDWNIIDTSRSVYNQTDNVLWANLSNADSAGQNTDILSNGFKLRSTGLVTNASGGTYIYACFAENPFKYSLAR